MTSAVYVFHRVELAVEEVFASVAFAPAAMYPVLYGATAAVGTGEGDRPLPKRADDRPPPSALSGTYGAPMPRLVTALVVKLPAVAGLAAVLVGTVGLEVEVDQRASRVVVPASGELVEQMLRRR